MRTLAFKKNIPKVYGSETIVFFIEDSCLSFWTACNSPSKIWRILPNHLCLTKNQHPLGYPKVAAEAAAAVKKGCSGKKSKSAKKGSGSGKKGSGKKGCTDDDDEDTLEPGSPTMAPGPTTPTAPTAPTGGGGTPPTAPTPTVAPTPTPVQSDFVTELDLSALDAQYHSFFQDAASMYSGIITGDLLDYTLTAEDKDSVSCANPPDVVDDVYICAAAAVGDGMYIGMIVRLFLCTLVYPTN